MSVQWFDTTRARRGASDGGVLAVVFTIKPKGVRFNSTLSRFLQEKKVTHVRIGLEGDNLIIKPAYEPSEGFKIAQTKSSCQVSSATIGNWATTHGLLKNYYSGVWDEAEGQLVFSIVKQA